MVKKIIKSLNKFDLNIENRIVLTEAASGNYVVTPIIAALGNAKQVFAYTKESKYATVDKVIEQTKILGKKFSVENKIEIITSSDEIPWNNIDILTNTGFNRPINAEIISKLKKGCVIPLMWEPWEYRENELDLNACLEKGIKVYGTNENDPRLKTMHYIGYTVLKFLLDNGRTPFSCKPLLLGTKKFIDAVSYILEKNDYFVQALVDYNQQVNIDDYDAIVILEHQRNLSIIGSEQSFIDINSINNEKLIIHICGNVNLQNAAFKYIPENPAPFGYMSFTTDFIDSQAVIDLHTAGLKVAEGMLKANDLGFAGLYYKKYMESNYPALSFWDEALW